MNRQDRNIEFPPSQGGAVNIVSKVPGWCGRSSGIVADTQPSVYGRIHRTSNPAVRPDTIEISDSAPVFAAAPAAVCSPPLLGCANRRAGFAGGQLQGREFAADCGLLPASAIGSAGECLLALHNFQRRGGLASIRARD